MDINCLNWHEDGKDEDSSSEVTEHIVVEVGHVAGVGAGISSAVVKNAHDVVYSR